MCPDSALHAVLRALTYNITCKYLRYAKKVYVNYNFMRFKVILQI